MDSVAKKLAILGSTGSIGTQTLDVVRSFQDRLHIVGLSAHKNLTLLADQINEFLPKLASCDGSQVEKSMITTDDCTFCTMEEIIKCPEIDLVINAISGNSGLAPTVSAIQAGKNIALANKESFVMAGNLLTKLALDQGVELLPLDSEPNAIWQCLRGENKTISRLIITASGGSFRDTHLNDLKTVSPEQALNHPTWKMGPKITVDSATLMNKAFEVIEAHWLFDVPWENIEVVIHPQSIIHSMVEFVDGSIKAQMSLPNMQMPIQYCLFYPERVPNKNVARFDPVSTGGLTFQHLDEERYPNFIMALNIAKRGGTWPAALCGADDKAVEMFLAGRISFLDIGTVICEAIETHRSVMDPSIQDILAAAAWANNRVNTLVTGA